MQGAYQRIGTSQHYLTSLSHKFSVIAVTETWANFTNESLLIIPGYNSIF